MRINFQSSNFFQYNLHTIRYLFGEHKYHMTKIWIDLNYRMVRSLSKRQFLLNCKYNNIFPSHLTHMNEKKFHFTHYKSFSRLESALQGFKTKLLNIEIFDVNRIIDSLTKKLSYFGRVLSDSLPAHIWNNMNNHHFRSFHNLYVKLQSTHRKKFQWISHKTKVNNIKRIKSIEYACNMKDHNYSFIKPNLKKTNMHNEETIVNIEINPSEFMEIAQDPLKITNDKWFINLSNFHIPNKVSNLLQFGDKFSLPSNLNNKSDIHEIIKDLENNIKRYQIESQVKIRNSIIPQFHRLLHIKTQQNSTSERIKSLINYTKQFCQNNPKVIFTRADKGNITVALNRDSYIKKMEEALGDTNTYAIVKVDPSSTIEKKLNLIIKKWLKNEYISKVEMLNLRSSDSLLPKAYGLPKIHKENTPLRIIVSSVNTSLYPVAKFLSRIISDGIPDSDYQAKNSFEMCNALSRISIPENHILASFDVVSLFTNVPLDLAIESVEKRWEHIERSTRMVKEDFIEAIKFVLSSTFFTFNDKLYKQTFGVPMGSPLSPIIANMVMQDLEEDILKNLNTQPLLYYRYVDDIILSAHESEIQNILNRFNGYHHRLKFTCETEVNRCLNFLDINVIIVNNRIITDWYQKKTSSGRYLSFHSNHPINHKVGTINNLIDRAVKLSHPSFHSKNLRLCIRMLLDNGYPLELIFNKINTRLKKIFTFSGNPLVNTTNNNNNSKEVRNVVVLPYVNPISKFITTNIDKTKAIIGFRCLNKLSQFIKVHKDKDPLLSKNNVVYKIFCKDCEASYVGQTKRQLKTRLKEHKNNIKLDQSRHSVISQHITECNHSFDWEGIKIMDRETKFHKRIVSEMIHIKEQKIGLNLNSDTELLDLSYSHILYELAKH